MGNLAKKIGQPGPRVGECHHDHEEENTPGAGGGGSMSGPAAGAGPGMGNQALMADLGLDSNQDGDAGLLETAGHILGGLFGQQGAQLGGLGGDWIEEQLAIARFEAFRTATHRVANYAFQGWGNFDLSYAPAAGTVTTTVRIKFDFVDGTPAPDQDAAGYTWSEEGKTAWKNDFMSAVEATWSGQHGFQCGFHDPELHASPRWEDLAPGVVVDVVEDEGNPHFAVAVQKIPDGGFARSEISRPTRNADGEVTSVGTGSLDSEDMDATTKSSSPTGVTQRGAVHEFGHMIGMQDEYTGSAESVGEATRQGTTKGMGKNASIMSGGEVIQQAHYSSILEALNAAVGNHGVSFHFA